MKSKQYHFKIFRISSCHFIRTCLTLYYIFDKLIKIYKIEKYDFKIYMRKNWTNNF